MIRTETPKPHEPETPVCTNKAYYDLFATTEERLAYYARLEQQREDERYKRLLRDLDILEDENDFLNQ